MSLLPLLLSELEDARRSDLFSAPFDPYEHLDMSPSFTLVAVPKSRHPSHPSHRRSAVSHIKDDKDAFKINVDVQQFRPEELSVKVADGYVVVDGKHEERQDEHGYVRREFTRRYALPGSVDPDSVTSSLSSDGVLMVSAPKKALAAPGQRSVPITHTNAPAVKHHPEADGKKSAGQKHGDVEME